MKGNDRILFVGNLNCLTLTSNDQKKQLSSMWQMKRVVITDHQILYFQHTLFDTYLALDLKLNVHYEQNLKIQSNETIPTLQQRYENTKDKTQIDINSITSSPMSNKQLKINIIHQITQRSVFLMTLESLDFQLQKLAITMPYTTGRGIGIYNKQTKEINYMATRSQTDAFRFVKAFNVAILFQKYYTFTKQNNIPLNQKILLWLQESINSQEDFDIELDYEFKRQLQIYELLIDGTCLICGININTNFENEDYLQGVKKILHYFRNQTQLTSLTIKNQKFNGLHLLELLPDICYHSQLVTLNLSGNLIEDKGMEIIGKIFEQTYEIRNIDLSRNLIQGGDVIFDLFLMKAGQLLSRAHINLSYNQLDDISIQSIENRVLFDELCNLEILDISNNRFTRNGSWRIYSSFLEIKEHKSDFTLVIFPLPLRFQAFQEIHPKLLNFAKRERRLPAVTQRNEFSSRQINDFNQQNLTISRKFAKFQQRDSLDQEEKSVTIIRNMSHKHPITNKVVLEKVRQLSRTAEQLFERYNDDPRVEDVYALTEQIKDFPYQVSLKLIALLSEHIWNKLNEAILVRDQYCSVYLSYAATNLQINQDFFHERFLRVQNRKLIIQQRIDRLLNFQIEESQINNELDDLIQECYHLDLRGLPFNTLLLIKTERDAMIQQMTLEEYDWQEEFI